MPGFEVIGNEEKKALMDIFEKSAGILFSHGFDSKRAGIFRIRDFESKISEKFNVKYAQAVSSGTAALKTGLKALGVKPGDEVITQAFTFVATVEAIIDCNAVPVIVDVDESLNMSPQALKEAITDKTKVVIPVHMMGVAAAMDDILSICRENQVLILEDNAQSCGASYKGRYLGTIGDIGCLSFDFGKVITSGEGGMVITNNNEYYVKSRAYHDHGHEYNKHLPRGIEGALMSGFNFRMTEMQAAVGLVQLAKLDEIISRQRENKKVMKDFLQQDLPALNVRFRSIVDKDGDIGDALVFFVGSKERACKVADELIKSGIGTKNLPDALKWHFAGEWGHLFEKYQGQELIKSKQLLEEAVALPVFLKDDSKILKEKMERVLKILKETSSDVAYSRSENSSL